MNQSQLFTFPPNGREPASPEVMREASELKTWELSCSLEVRWEEDPGSWAESRHLAHLLVQEGILGGLLTPQLVVGGQ